MNRDMRDYMERDSRRDYNYDERNGRGRDSRRDYRYEDERYYDGRNPYGSKGGYVRDYRDGRDYEERDYSMRFQGTIDRRGMDSRRDYNDFGGGYLSNKELRKWQTCLCKHMDPQEIEMFSYDPIIKQAEQMNIRFDRYSKEEFFTTVLMMYTDYYKSCGNNVPMYIALAKDFLEDDDAKVQGGEKLACYYDCIADV